MTEDDNGQDRLYRLLLDPRLDEAWPEAKQNDFWAAGHTFVAGFGVGDKRLRLAGGAGGRAGGQCTRPWWRRLTG